MGCCCIKNPGKDVSEPQGFPALPREEEYRRKANERKKFHEQALDERIRNNEMIRDAEEAVKRQKEKVEALKAAGVYEIELKKGQLEEFKVINSKDQEKNKVAAEEEELFKKKELEENEKTIKRLVQNREIQEKERTRLIVVAQQTKAELDMEMAKVIRSGNTDPSPLAMKLNFALQDYYKNLGDVNNEIIELDEKQRKLEQKAYDQAVLMNNKYLAEQLKKAVDTHKSKAIVDAEANKAMDEIRRLKEEDQNRVADRLAQKMGDPNELMTRYKKN